MSSLNYCSDNYIHYYQFIENQINTIIQNTSIPEYLALKGQYISKNSEAMMAVHQVIKTSPERA